MKTVQISFRKDTLESLTTKPKRYEIQDTKVSALRLCVFPTNVKTFYLYRKILGKAQRIKIGRYPTITIEQARKKAVMLNAQIELGENLILKEKESKNRMTFNQLFDRYCREHLELHRKGSGEIKKLAELHIFPTIGSNKLDEVSRDRVAKMFRDIASRRGKGAANRVISYVSATFNFGISRDLFSGLNPCLGIKKFKLVSRDRFLSEGELKKFINAVEQEKSLYKDYFLLLLYTGARKRNVMSMKWADVQFEQKRWRISESEAKNGDVNIVHLSDKALSVLKARDEQNHRQITPSLFVFPGDGKLGHLHDAKKAFNRIKRRMNVHDIRIHDLRRTLGSYMAINGASLITIGKALNHKSSASTEIYARLSENAVLQAVNKTANLFD